MDERNLPDLEKAVISYLKALTGKRVLTGVPDPRPLTFVRVMSTGGGTRNRVQISPTLLVEVWGTKNAEGGDPRPLLKQVWEALGALAESDALESVQVMRASCTVPANYPDEASGSPRYTFLLSMIVNTN